MLPENERRSKMVCLRFREEHYKQMRAWCKAHEAKTDEQLSLAAYVRDIVVKHLDKQKTK